MNRIQEVFQSKSIEITPQNVHHIIATFKKIGFRLTKEQEQELVNAALIGCRNPPEAA